MYVCVTKQNYPASVRNPTVLPLIVQWGGAASELESQNQACFIYAMSCLKLKCN